MTAPSARPPILSVEQLTMRFGGLTAVVVFGPPPT